MNANELQHKSLQGQQNDTGDFEPDGQTFTDKARAFKEAAQRWSRQASDSTRKAAKATDEYVRENPWTAIGCVAAGCFIIGYLLGRSRD